MTTFFKPKATDVVDLGAIDQRWKGIYGKFINLGDESNLESPYILVEVDGKNKPSIRYNKNTSKWEFTHDGITWLVVGGEDWVNIENKPSSTVQQLDLAVSNSHTHSNKETLDLITEAFTTELKTSYDIKEDASNKGQPGGYASLDDNGKILVTELPTINTVSIVVDKIANRNALTNLVDGMRVIVLDASDDETVTSGAAEYIYYNNNWIKLSEVESMDLVLKWENLENKPSSLVDAIDSAVNSAHIHINMETLDKFSEDNEGNLLYNDNLLSVDGDIDLSKYLLKPEIDGSEGNVLSLDTSGNNVWRIVEESTLDDFTYTNEEPTPITIGGIPQSSMFHEVPITEMFNRLLYPYQKPNIMSFNLSNVPYILEVGNSILEEKTFTWSISNNLNLKENSITIKQYPDIILGEELEDSGTYTLTESNVIKNIIPAQVFFSIEAIDIKNNIISDSFSISWRYKSYALSSMENTLTEELIKNSVKKYDDFSAGAYTVTFTADNPGYKYFIVPSSETLYTFTDTSTQLSVPFNNFYIVEYTNEYDVTYDYKVYRSINILNGHITIRAN